MTAAWSSSTLEDAVLGVIKSNRLPSPELEYRFDSTRRWRFDFAWPQAKIAIECEGGVWTGGRHTRGAGFEGDVEKYNAASLAGWTVYRVTAVMVRSGACGDLVRKLRDQIADPMTVCAAPTTETRATV